jgi:hypothetical protein
VSYYRGFKILPWYFGHTTNVNGHYLRVTGEVAAMHTAIDLILKG